MRVRVTLLAFAVACLGGGTATALLNGVDSPASVDAAALRVATPFRPDRTPAERAAHDLVDIVNLERNRRGMPILIWNDAVAEAAVAHSRDMATRGQLVHDGSDGSTVSDRLERAGFAWLDWGEVIAAGFATPPPLYDVWMDSPAHRRHLMGEQRFVGAGVAVTPAGVTYWTLIVAS